MPDAGFRPMGHFSRGYARQGSYRDSGSGSREWHPFGAFDTVAW